MRTLVDTVPDLLHEHLNVNRFGHNSNPLVRTPPGLKRLS
jgi:hypothetical protein